MTEPLYGADQERKAIWVFLEQENGALENVSLELLAKGRQMADALGWSLVALVLGSGVEPLVAMAWACGAEEVWLADHPLLERFTIDGYGRVVFAALMEGRPSVFLCGATPNGRDLAGRLAVRLRTGLNADCTDLRMDAKGELLVSEVSGFGGGVLALIEMRHHRPQMATVRPGVFPPAVPVEGRQGKLVRIPADLTPGMIRTRIVERVTAAGVDLTRSPVLIAGGRGIDGDFAMLQELADLLGGDIGGTRPPVDDGFIVRERQIGQTGVVCRPKVAICCGISGAFHFVVGVEKSGLVISINTDPEAPMFEFSDYCIIGDAHQIVPALITALREAEVAYA
jgi:electron transfer flavoprotein alpha subunit